MKTEPVEAFPYKPPTAEIQQRYHHVFELNKPLPTRWAKVLFDKLVASLMLIISAPILLLLKVAYVIEGWLLPDNAGPMFFYYNAVSAGRVFPKYKIRLIKTKYIEPEGRGVTIGLRTPPSGHPTAVHMSVAS